MNRKFKLFFSLASLCLSVAMLCFGVYSAMSVSYTVNGSVSYEVKDVFVNINTRIYRATSDTPIDESQNNANVTTITNAGENISSDFAQLTGEGYTNQFEGYDAETGSVTEPGASNYDVPEYNVPNLTYGAPDDTDQTGYAFYIVIDIANYGSQSVHAIVTNETTVSTQNTYFSVPTGINIAPRGENTYTTGRLVIGLALQDVTRSASGDFGFKVEIGMGETTFGYSNIQLSSSETTAVVKSVTVGSSTTTYEDASFASVGTISMGAQEIAPKEELTAKIVLSAKDSTSSYQRVRLTYENLPDGLRVNSTSIFLPKDGEEKTYTIKFYNQTQQTQQPISLENVQVTVSLEDVKSLLMQDTDYYYVEMGTVMRATENEYIRWRYVADTTRTQGSSTPTDLSSLNGTYLLETNLTVEYIIEPYNILINNLTQEGMQAIDEYLANNYTGTVCAYQSQIYVPDTSDNDVTNAEYGTNANEYKTSTVRRWMNYTGDNKVVKHSSWVEAGVTIGIGSQEGNTISVGENTQAQASNMVTDLNIDIEQDIIYKQIFARSLTNDLYKDISEEGQALTVPQGDVYGLSDTGSDKFWLLSVAEANTIFTSDEEEQRLDIWWLRSPYSSDTFGAYYVGDVGVIISHLVIIFNAARPAFQIGGNV